jgi:antitoxin MazE
VVFVNGKKTLVTRAMAKCDVATFIGENLLEILLSCNYNVIIQAREIHMRTRIVRIGNSQGIRIPKAIIEQCHLGIDVELEVKDQKLIICSAACPRQGWGEKFEVMATSGDASLLDGELINQSTWDEKEWEW